jgi:hypothetical protein
VLLRRGGGWIEIKETRQLLVCADVVNVLGGKLDTVGAVNADRVLLTRMQDRDTT